MFSVKKQVKFYVTVSAKLSFHLLCLIQTIGFPYADICTVLFTSWDWILKCYS